MPIAKNIVLAAAFSLVGVASFAQDVNDIINKNITAMGGKDKLSKLVSVYEENSTSVMGNDINSKIWVVNAQSMRMEMEVMGSSIIMVITKDTGWMVNPLTGNSDPQALPTSQLKQSMAQMNLQGQFLNYAANGYTATLLPPDTLNGKTNYKLKLSKEGEEYTYFIDQTTYYVNKVTSVVKVDGNDVNGEITLADYKVTPEGFIFPYTTIINSPQAQGEIRNTLTKVVPNQTIDPKLFQKP